ncbi:8-oxo-dGTP diphosphatase [Herbihabitans rhizosphaerae]|uniref:8-oxo-dGTP diphosphatase n=1 Tax=Herbihabitans rhizosphaerae TaxID=1872711 RepID=A0A4Q7KEV8_9PSEU|nr:NUDIX hydrolase [Herbihabitans rhizosphaerae]RZS32490.1 8-oxo-dGTP diphosphatase [Herbihabitans rhizosphaerae]
MSEHATPPISAAVVVQGGKVLLVRRRVKEGSLSWQFPAGAIEEGETSVEAAVRETQEETGLVVKASEVLGERVHPNTGRTMVYVACEAVSGDARVVDDEELAEFSWVSKGELNEYVPYGFFGPVQDHLQKKLDA